jgi:hypothetical protein
MEDAAHGRDRRGDELPQELARRQSRLAKIQEAKALLEERARTEAAEEAARRQEEGKAPPAVPPAKAVPEPKDQINFTDPESRIMKVSNKGWDQCGNAQAVANEHQIILAADVTHRTNDKRQAVPMVLIDTDYEPFTPRPRPEGRVIYLRPAQEHDYLASLAEAGLIQYLVSDEA